MNHIQIVADFKVCHFCKQFMIFPQFLDNDYFFYCNNCSLWVNWKAKTSLEKCKVSYFDLEMLVILFLENKSPSQALSTLKNPFFASTITKNTVYKYFNLFGDIAFSYYKQKVRSTFLSGEIELGETVVFKVKRTRAKRRRNCKLKYQWLLGIIERKSKDFIVIPICTRNEPSILIPLLKYVECESTIYTDCLSVYVKNRKLPKESRLIDYGYNHHYIDHSVEFVSERFGHIHTNTIERLWKSIKTDLRSKRITTGYLKAIGRFYFHKTLTKEQQLTFIRNHINSMRFL